VLRLLDRPVSGRGGAPPAAIEHTDLAAEEAGRSVGRHVPAALAVFAVEEVRQCSDKGGEVQHSLHGFLLVGYPFSYRVRRPPNLFSNRE
jgi:hypothetical protein